MREDLVLYIAKRIEVTIEELPLGASKVLVFRKNRNPCDIVHAPIKSSGNILSVSLPVC